MSKTNQTTPDIKNEVPLNLIRPNPYQPRKTFDVDELLGLAHTIQRRGLIQPIAVLPGDDEQHILDDGERRWRASCALAISNGNGDLRKTVDLVCRDRPEEWLSRFNDALKSATIKVTILNADPSPRGKRARALIANLQRADLNPLERAQAIKKLQETEGLNNSEMAHELGVSQTTVGNWLMILKLDEAIQHLIAAKKLPHGREAIKALLDIPHTEARIKLAQRLAKKPGMTVRSIVTAAKRLIQQLQTQTGESPSKPPKPQKFQIGSREFSIFVSLMVGHLQKSALILDECILALEDREESDDALADKAFTQSKILWLIIEKAKEVQHEVA